MDRERAVDGFLSDKNEAVRDRAVLALGRANDTLALDSLRRVLLGDPSAKVRGTAAFAVSAWTWKVGKAALLEALEKEQDPEALVQILQSLARTYAREEYELYYRFLHHPDTRVRAQTALTLDMINRRESADSIIVLLKDPDSFVRETALISSPGWDRRRQRAAPDSSMTQSAIRAAAYRVVGSTPSVMPRFSRSTRTR
jgi:HEAT repeat protein